MEYGGFSVRVIRNREYNELPIKPTCSSDISGYPSRNRKQFKEALATSARLEMSIKGLAVYDMGFVYELRAVLEEFINRRLGKYQDGEQLNLVVQPLQESNDYIIIKRYGSELVMMKHFYEDDEESQGEYEMARFDVIKAKTLHAILHKAIQCSDFD